MKIIILLALSYLEIPPRGLSKNILEVSNLTRYLEPWHPHASHTLQDKRKPFLLNEILSSNSILSLGVIFTEESRNENCSFFDQKKFGKYNTSLLFLCQTRKPSQNFTSCYEVQLDDNSPLFLDNFLNKQTKLISVVPEILNMRLESLLSLWTETKPCFINIYKSNGKQEDKKENCKVENICFLRSYSEQYFLNKMKSSTKSACPPDWILTNNICIFMSRFKSSYRNASRNCEAMNSSLLNFQRDSDSLQIYNTNVLTFSCPVHWIYVQSLGSCVQLLRKLKVGKRNLKLCSSLNSRLFYFHSYKDLLEVLSELYRVSSDKNFNSKIREIKDNCFHRHPTSEALSCFEKDFYLCHKNSQNFKMWIALNTRTSLEEKKDCPTLFENKLSYESCNYELPFVCFKPQRSFMETNNECSENQFLGQTYCYELNQNPLSLNEAKKHCHEQKASLLNIRHAETQLETSTFLSSLSFQNTHLGVKYENLFKSWLWLDEDSQDLDYENWSLNQNLSSGLCASLQENGSWIYSSCLHTHPFICMHSKAFSECPFDFTSYHHHCYKALESHSYSYESSHDYCVSLNGYLVSIGDEKENTMLASIISQNTRIGLRAHTVTHSFDWDDSTTNYEHFQNWKPENPKLENGTQNCVAIDKDSHLWYSVNCSLRMSFLCEINQMTSSDEKSTESSIRACGNDSETDWMYFEESNYCYKFFILHKNLKEGASWHEAKRICRDNDGQMVSIHSQSTNDFIFSQFPKEFMSDHNSWIGLNSLHNDEDIFEWDDESTLDYIQWESGEPNNGMDMESCVSLDTFYEGSWKDEHCDSKHSFACQKYLSNSPLSTPSSPQDPEGHCESNYLEFKGHCYDYNRNGIPFNWKEARKMCKKQNMDLVSIHSQAELSFLISEILSESLASSDYNYWIGLNKINSKADQYSFHWSDESPLDFTNFAPQHPLSISDYGVEMESKEEDLGEWKSISSLYKNNYICKKKGRSDILNSSSSLIFCEDSHHDTFISRHNDCWFLSNEVKTWKEAVAFCETLNASLLSLHSRTEQAFAFNFIRDTSESWIGLTSKDGRIEGWTDGSAYDYHNFGVNVSEYKGNCVFINKYEGNGKWNFENCESLKSFMCVFHKRSYVIEDPVNFEEGSCPSSNWESFPSSKYCYKVFERLNVKDVFDAMSHCTDLNAKLPSIESAIENDFLSLLLSRKNISGWIGLHRKFEGKFKWEDGHPYIGCYTNWKSANEMLKEECVTLDFNTGKWNSVPCNVKNPFACQIKKIVTHVTNGESTETSTFQSTSSLISTSSPSSTQVNPILTNEQALSLSGMIALIGCLFLLSLALGIAFYFNYIQRPLLQYSNNI